MERITIPRRGWVLVCDGAKALILQNEGDAELVNLKLVDVVEDEQPAARDLAADRPGRVQPPPGGNRSAVEEIDLHEAAEAAFLARIVGEVHDLLLERQARSLVLVAPPRALGVIRGRLTPTLRHLVKHELAKDLVALPVGQIERHLAGG